MRLRTSIFRKALAAITILLLVTVMFLWNRSFAEDDWGAVAHLSISNGWMSEWVAEAESGGECIAIRLSFRNGAVQRPPPGAGGWHGGVVRTPVPPSPAAGNRWGAGMISVSGRTHYGAPYLGFVAWGVEMHRWQLQYPQLSMDRYCSLTVADWLVAVVLGGALVLFWILWRRPALIAESSQASPVQGDSPPVLNYQRRERGWTIITYLRALPRPNPMTVLTIAMSAAMAFWFFEDSQPWIPVRQFAGAIPEEMQPQAAISADGRRLATVDHNRRTLCVYDIARGQRLLSFEAPCDFNSDDDVRIFALSPDGSSLWYCNNLGFAELIEVSSHQHHITNDDRAAGTSCSALNSPFSANNKWLAVGGSEHLEIFDGHTGTLVHSLANGWFPVFSPNCRYLAAWSPPSSQPNGGPGTWSIIWPTKVLIWDTQTWKQCAAFSQLSPPFGQGGEGCLAFSGDSRLLAIAHDQQVSLWDAGTRSVSTLFITSDDIWKVLFSPDGRFVLVAANPWECFDRMTGRIVSQPIYGSPHSLISPDGRFVASEWAIYQMPGLRLVQQFTDRESGVTWLPTQDEFIRGSPNMASELLYKLRRPTAAYGVFWLANFWLMLVSATAAGWLIVRDARRWRRQRTGCLTRLPARTTSYAPRQ